MGGTWFSLMTADEKEYLSMDLTQIIKARQVRGEWLRNAAAYGA
jgi:hypothetical protein